MTILSTSTQYAYDLKSVKGDDVGSIKDIWLMFLITH